MAITESDIKLLKSARMTDTADGGGQMTGNVVQSGVDNNIFDDVSALDRVYGNVSLRKVFPAVLTNTTDKFLGARVIIDKPPADSYVSGTLFAASSLFDVRSEAQSRVEAYLAAGAPYAGLLYGPHITGMMVVSLLQRGDRGLPTIGQVLILKKNIGLVNETEQFVRVTDVESTTYTFTDSQGDYQRSVVTCSISDPLREDFPGWEARRTDSELDYTGKSRVFESVVANAAQYYSIKSLQNAASLGDYNIKIDSSHAQLLPSSQVETPIADASAAGYSAVAVSVGDVFTVTGAYTLTTSQSIYIGGAIAPATLLIEPSGWTNPLVDDGTGTLTYGGAEVGAVDYANGVVSLSDPAYQFTSSATVSYKVAGVPSAALRSLGFEITSENRSLSYVRTLPTVPAVGSTVLSYMVEGKWYVIRDNGDGTISGQSGQGAGSINYTTGTVTVTLGALPDVGGHLIYQWAEKSSVVSQTAATIKRKAHFSHSFASTDSLFPDLLTVTWNDGTARSATMSAGVFSGDGTGWVEGNTLHFAPNVLPASGTAYSISGKAAATLTHTAGDVTATSIGAAVKPGTVVINNVLFSVTFTVSGTVDGATLYIAGAALPGATMGWLSNLSATGSINRTVLDDGAGNLYVTIQGSEYGGVQQPETQVNVGTVNYTTGAIAVSASVTMPNTTPGVLVGYYKNNGAVIVPWLAVPAANRTSTIACAGQPASVKYTGTTGSTVTASPTPSSYKVTVGLSGTRVLRSASMQLGSVTYKQDTAIPTVLLRDVNPITGLGTTSGSVYTSGDTGTITMTYWQTGANSMPTAFAAALLSPADAEDTGYISAEATFHTPLAPLRPSGFSILGTTADGQTFNVTADSLGLISSPKVVGAINYQTGVCTVFAVEDNPNRVGTAPVVALPDWIADLMGAGTVLLRVSGFRTTTLRYNAVAYSYLPLDADILGLDPVRLPTDGRVPVFKAGRVAVVHNTQSLPAATVSNGQTVNCGRTLLSRIRVFGNDGLEITSGFSKNLDAGTITFTNVAGYSQPVTVEHRIEDEALCADVQISGQIRLSRPLTHNYPVPGTYVSSAYVQGTLQAAAQDAFSQLAWTNVWSNSIIGDPILAQYNDTANPIVVTNAGAITERWAIIFQTNTTFNLVGEEVGVILSGSTGADLAPVNPATGVPYFTLAAAGWGTGWVAGNVLRFNTAGANFPLWVARTVMQSPAAAPGTDQLVISIRGDIDV